MRTPIGRRPSRLERAERFVARGAVLLTAALAIGAGAGWSKRVRAADDPGPLDAHRLARQFGSLSAEVSSARGEVALARLQLERANAVIDFSAKYQIPADLAASIYDLALAEGLDPALAFRLVKVESNFQRDARSVAGALGYTQVQLATARFYDPTITAQKLLERDTNLRIGFRFLKELLGQFGNDMHLALLAYNRGPARVAQILEQGGNPKNGYSDEVLRGYRPPRAAAEPDGWR